MFVRCLCLELITKVSTCAEGRLPVLAGGRACPHSCLPVADPAHLLEPRLPHHAATVPIPAPAAERAFPAAGLPGT